MIQFDDFILDIDSSLFGLKVKEYTDTFDLALIAQKIKENNIKTISLHPNNISFIWNSFEKDALSPIIFARYKFDAKKNIDTAISELAQNIVSAYKSGATGVDVFIDVSDIENFVNGIKNIQNDLFFGHKFCISCDVLQINTENRDFVFNKLKELNLNKINFTCGNTNDSDFTGNLYGILNDWNENYNIWFSFDNDYKKIDKAYRLMALLQPKLLENVCFFVKD